jgi:hypothetical protein
MAQGISLHIGLNRVNPAAYNNWDGQLSGCINDAKAMQSIADSIGYSSSMLTDDQATSAAVLEAIGKAAQQLESGDILLLTYSGHGGQVPDVNGDEDDGQDETLVLYDRMLVDDELYQMWKQFKEGVRIFMLSDSCHSGTVAKVAQYTQLTAHPTLSKDYKPNGKVPKFRVIPADVARAAYTQHKDVYDSVQWAAGKKRGVDDVSASLILISGCLDNQLSSDGDGNGLFTANLLAVWNDGSFTGNYSAFWQQILARMPGTQSPNLFKVGEDNTSFNGEKPFTITGAHGASTANGANSAGSDGSSAGSGSAGTQGGGTSPAGGAGPTVTGPARVSRQDAAPTFDVDSGANPYFVFEITSDPDLFNSGGRTTDNFYASWDDDNASARLTGSRYTLPDSAWESLKAADRLYYRIGSTSSANSWADYQVSVADDRGSEAPSFMVEN